MSGEEKTAASLKPSISRLRALRDKLCSKQSDWKAAFEVRDYVLHELVLLHEMLSDNTIARTTCIEKTKSILATFEDSQHKNNSEE
jgi:hypothetical protein